MKKACVHMVVLQRVIRGASPINRVRRGGWKKRGEGLQKHGQRKQCWVSMDGPPNVPRCNQRSAVGAKTTAPVVVLLLLVLRCIHRVCCFVWSNLACGQHHPQLTPPPTPPTSTGPNSPSVWHPASRDEEQIERGASGSSSRSGESTNPRIQCSRQDERPRAACSSRAGPPCRWSVQPSPLVAAAPVAAPPAFGDRSGGGHSMAGWRRAWRSMS